MICENQSIGKAMFIAYKNRFIVLLDIFLIGIGIIIVIWHLIWLAYLYLIFGVSFIFQTHFVVVYFVGGLACVDLQDSATLKSENTSPWLLSRYV